MVNKQAAFLLSQMSADELTELLSAINEEIKARAERAKVRGQDIETPQTAGKRRVTFSNLKRGDPRLSVFLQTNPELLRKAYARKDQERPKQQVTSDHQKPDE